MFGYATNGIERETAAPTESSLPFVRSGLPILIGSYAHPSTRKSRLCMFRGRVFYTLGRTDEAIREFRAALRLNWRDAEAAAWICKLEQTAQRPSGRPLSSAA